MKKTEFFGSVQKLAQYSIQSFLMSPCNFLSNELGVFSGTCSYSWCRGFALVWFQNAFLLLLFLFLFFGSRGDSKLTNAKEEGVIVELGTLSKMLRV